MELIDAGIGRSWEPLFYMESAEERMAWMEGYLFEKLDKGRYSPELYNAIGLIIGQAGRSRLRDICEYSCVSQRQLERLFNERIGMSAKRMSCLVRYQNVWGGIWQAAGRFPCRRLYTAMDMRTRPICSMNSSVSTE